MYDPIIGRFLSPDSIIPDIYNPQALNRYSYCLNNPLIYTDPTGHSWVGDLMGWIGRTIGSLVNAIGCIVPVPFINPFQIFGHNDNVTIDWAAAGIPAPAAVPGVTQTGYGGPGQMDEFTLDEIVVNGGAKCPPSPPVGDPRWKDYKESWWQSTWLFHGGYDTYHENRPSTPECPTGECVYDEFGRLVDKNHRYPGTMGTPNQYDDAFNHTINDLGGPRYSGVPALEDSIKKHLLDYFEVPPQWIGPFPGHIPGARPF